MRGRLIREVTQVLKEKVGLSAGGGGGEKYGISQSRVLQWF